MKTVESKQSRSFWGKGIAILCAGFVIFILSLVWFSSCQNFDLVEKGYYQKELAYQQQIDRVKRTQLLAANVRINLGAEQRILTIQFPSDSLLSDISGSIKLYKPSDAGQDRTLPLTLDAHNRHEIDMTGYSAGLWRVYVNWVSESNEYYTEEMIVIPGAN